MLTGFYFKKMAEQKDYPGLKYIRMREAYNNSIGIFRCDKKLEGAYQCPEQCEKCSEYYKSKSIEK